MSDPTPRRGEDLVWEDAPRRRSRDEVAGARIARWVVAVGALGALLVGLLLVTGTPDRGDALDGVPREVVGRWATTHERYAGRTLLLEEGRIEIVTDTGAAGRGRHTIREVRGWEEEGGRGYRIRYETPDGERTLDLLITPDGTLRLKNPPDVVWRRLP